jgi:hypothetical protein
VRLCDAPDFNDGGYIHILWPDNNLSTVAISSLKRTQVGTEEIDAETMSVCNRAVTEVVRRINADKRGYLQYFIDYHTPRNPEIGTLSIDDLCDESPRRLRAGADPAR